MCSLLRVLPLFVFLVFIFVNVFFSALFGLLLGPRLDLLFALFGLASGHCLDLLLALLRRVALSSSLALLLCTLCVLLVVRRVLCVDSFTAMADHASSLCGNRHQSHHQPPHSCIIHRRSHIISHRHHQSNPIRRPSAPDPWQHVTPLAKRRKLSHLSDSERCDEFPPF